MQKRRNNYLIRLCKDSFVREVAGLIYIRNQLTKHDRVYNESGSLFLSKISRHPKSKESIIDELLSEFINVNREILEMDFNEFIEDLENDKYIVIGEKEEELNKKEPSFSYSMGNPKTMTKSYKELLKQREDYQIETTSDKISELLKNDNKVFALQIELTSKCNERCIHCYIPHHTKTEILPQDVIKRVLDEARDMGTLGVTLSGGEPLLHPNIHEIIDHCRENDFSITLLTNALLIDDELIDNFKKNNLDFVQVSVYSMNPKVHDAVTAVDGSFDKTISNIEKMIKNDIPVQISCPVMKPNYRDYKDVLKWARERKINANTDFIISAQTDFNNDNLKYRLSIEEVEELMKDIIKNDEIYRENLMVDEKEVERNPDAPVCGAGYNFFSLAADGNYFPCSSWQDYDVGNAYNQSLKDVWENSDKLKYLRGIKRRDLKKCEGCEVASYCSYCFVRNYNENGGDMLTPSPFFCEAAFTNKKIAEEFRESIKNKNA